jgi:hypothetical protein
MKSIPLTQGKFALVDEADFDELNRHRWHYVKVKKGGGYASRWICQYTPGSRKKIGVRMHNQILPPPDGMKVDHRNRNGLDNQRHNLRFADGTQQMANRRTWKRKRFKGVYSVQNKHSVKWVGQIRVNGRLIILGRHPTEEAAAIAYNEAATKHFGEFAVLNEVPNDR